MTRFTISPEDLTFRSRHGLAISPDGRTLAFTRNGQLYLRDLDRLETTALPGTEGARSLAFSPDGQWIAFESNGLKKSPVSGGTPVNVSPASRQHGISWVDDKIYFAEWGSAQGRIVRMSANGGEPEVLVEPEDNERLYFPRLLPDGHTLVFTSKKVGQSKPLIMSYSLDTGERQVLVDGGSDAHYLSSEHLVYRVGFTLQAVRFELDALEVAGGASTVVEGVAPVVGGGDRGGAQFAVSESGSLFYLSGDIGDQPVVWVDRQGEREPLALPPALYRDARISPDETSLAILLDDDIWLYDITRGAMSRLTFTADNNRHFWTPDGKAIVFDSQRNGTDHVFWQPADGSGEAEQLTTGELDRHPEAISPDGSFLVFHEHYPENQTDLWVLEMNGDGETRLFLRTEFFERFAEVSPDGRWLAYVSNESGEAEVQVRPFPDGGGKTIVSTDSGSRPAWSADGRELFYSEGRRVMAVPVELGEELTVGAPTFLFQASFDHPIFASAFDVTADGERFVLVESPSQARAELHVVLNWFEELKRLVPTDN